MKLILLLMFVMIFIPVIVQASSNRLKVNDKVNILTDIFKYNDDSKRNIELTELSQGCRRVDCIPAINDPKFAAINNIDFIHQTDVMMLVKYNGLEKAYSRKIMQNHEIVNDYFGNKPVAMTYCPLCGSSVAFIPLIDNERVEFGVSGLLHNSDLVMYDRKTNSLWGQITGRSIVGPKTNSRLQSINVVLMSWEQLKIRYPNTQVLLPPEKYKGRYKKFNYQKYTESDNLMFPVSLNDARLTAKQYVYGIEIDGTFIAFEENTLMSQTPMVESYGKRILKVSYVNGEVTAIDKRTGDSFEVLRLYWFAWYAFHPTTILRN